MAAVPNRVSNLEEIAPQSTDFLFRMDIFLFATIVTCLVPQINVAGENPSEIYTNDSSLRTATKVLSQSQRNFATELYKKFSNQMDESFVVCPAATWLGLSKILHGSKNPTRRKLRKALHYKVNCEHTKNGCPYFGEIVTKKTLGEIRSKFGLSNDLYHGSEVVLRDDFRKLLRNEFKSTAMDLNFYKIKAQAEFARIMEPNSSHIEGGGSKVGRNEEVVLVDTGVYEMDWPTNDSNCAFRPLEFYPHQGAPKKLKFVHKVVDAMYGVLRLQCGLMTYIAFPLVDDNSKYLLIMVSHHERTGPLNFHRIERDIDGSVIEDILSSANWAKFRVFLPIFDTLASTNITEDLKQMSFGAAFGKKDDLYPMVGNQTIVINSFLHNVRFRVGGQSETKPGECLQSIRYVFDVTRPFIYAVVAKKNWLVLLMGRYTGE